MRNFLIILVVLALAGCANTVQRLEPVSVQGEPWMRVIGTNIKFPMLDEFSSAQQKVMRSINGRQQVFIIMGVDGSTHTLTAVERYEHDAALFDEMRSDKSFLKTTGEAYCDMGQPMDLVASSVFDNGTILFRCERGARKNTKSIALLCQERGSKARLYVVGYARVSGGKYSQDYSLSFQRMVEEATFE